MMVWATRLLLLVGATALFAGGYFFGYESGFADGTEKTRREAVVYMKDQDRRAVFWLDNLTMCIEALGKERQRRQSAERGL